MVKKETLLAEVVQAVSAGPANVTLLLPFHISDNDTIHARLMPGEQEKIYDKSEMALQFYEGFLLALDTLDQMGYKVKLKVVDTENRPWKASEMVAKGWLDNSELIIGPFYSKVFTEAANYAMEHHIPIVSPTIKGNDIVSENPYVFKLLPTDETLISDMGRYLSRSDSTNNLILHYGAAEEQSMIWRFKQGLEGVGYLPPKFPTYDLNKSGLDSLRLKLSSSKRNNIIILSNNQVRLAGLLRKLSGWAEDRRIVVFAPESWRQLKNLEVDHFDDLRIHMPVAMQVNYEQLDVQEFVLKFREKFNSEPNSFAFRGYDIAMHFIRNMDGIRNNGVDYMESVKEKGFQTEFSWKRIPEGGFENTHGRMVDHTDLNVKLAVD
jgi:ABC-type branched-subunit amino acid transport system substrate-binding protein